MAYSLADNLHYTAVDGQFIFLDLTSDRYFALPPSLNGAFNDLLAGADTADPAVMGGLLETGVVVRSAEASWPQPAPVATATAALPGKEPSRASDIARALASQYQAMWQLRRLDLADVLAWASRARPSGASKRKDASRIARAFAGSNALLSLHDNCLMKSIALLRSLRRNGHGAELVIGVQARPFAAHCWVQWEGMVLNDDPDHVHTFVPIFALQ